VSVVTEPGLPKQLRADAERNRQRILDAAAELFAQRGLAVTLNDIAHHAGVGVGTVYRRFPDKKQLIDGLFEQALEDMEALMKTAVADPDPWHGLSGFLEQALELQAGDRGLKDLISSSPDGLERVDRIRSRLMPLGFELVRRAQEAGQLRPDVDPGLWRRYLQIILRGLSAHPEDLEPLSPGPVAIEDVSRVMSALRPAGR
jgi:AcrR family transcriptional regulator